MRKIAYLVPSVMRPGFMQGKTTALASHPPCFLDGPADVSSRSHQAHRPDIIKRNSLPGRAET